MVGVFSGIMALPLRAAALNAKPTMLAATHMNPMIHSDNLVTLAAGVRALNSFTSPSFVATVVVDMFVVPFECSLVVLPIVLRLCRVELLSPLGGMVVLFQLFVASDQVPNDRSGILVHKVQFLDTRGRLLK
jgi:hypothetical protein